MERLLVLDTNVFLFYLAAQVDRGMLRGYKRLSHFRMSDLASLRDLVSAYSELVTTPHILTETSNLLDQAPLPWRSRLIEALRVFVRSHQERYEPAMGLVEREEFAELALADVGLLSLSKSAAIATLDGSLYQQILARGGEAVHFDHVRGRAASGKF